jgi:hypothetical protein
MYNNPLPDLKFIVPLAVFGFICAFVMALGTVAWAAWFIFHHVQIV